jgi:hypothetical protein
VWEVGSQLSEDRERSAIGALCLLQPARPFEKVPLITVGSSQFPTILRLGREVSGELTPERKRGGVGVLRFLECAPLLD